LLGYGNIEIDHGILNLNSKTVTTSSFAQLLHRYSWNSTINVFNGNGGFNGNNGTYFDVNITGTINTGGANKWIHRK